MKQSCNSLVFFVQSSGNNPGVFLHHQNNTTMKKIALALIALAFCHVSFATAKPSPEVKPTTVVSATKTDPNLITGKVIDKTTKEALAGAVVECDNQKAYTDLDGNFTIRRSKKASELVVRLISYTPVTLKLNEIQEQCVSIDLSQR